MRHLVITLSAAALMAGCSTTADFSNPKTASVVVQECTGYERGRLTGLRWGAKRNPPNAETERGRNVIEEIAFLEMKCESA